GTDPPPADGRGGGEVEPGGERNQGGLELRQSRDLGRDHGDGHQEQRGMALQQPEGATHAVAEQGADREGGGEPEQRIAGDRRVQRARAGEYLAGGEQQREQDRRGYGFEHRDGQERPSERAAGPELAEHTHRHGRRRHG